MKQLVAFFLLFIALASCHYPHPETTGEPYAVVRKNANLELYADSAVLELYPVKDSYISLYKGAQVVVAEFAIHAEDSVDSVWVKVAHTQKAQGWLRQRDLTTAFVPVNAISQFIHLFSHTYASYFVSILALFIGIYLFRAHRRKQIRMVYFSDIDSIYPLLLCLLMAVSATLYASIQLFAPQTWQVYFFNPTLSPFDVPLLLAIFLLTLWFIMLVVLAAFDDISRLIPSLGEAFFYVLGLLSACIFCYFFFIFTTRYYVGYLFLAIAFVLFVRKARAMTVYRYRCGNCGGRLQTKGVCPQCGALNR